MENVGHAHVCAERALAAGGVISERAAGQVPFKIFKNIGTMCQGVEGFIYVELFLSSLSNE